MVQRIIFDLDDTLVRTGDVFQGQIDTFVDLVRSEFDFVEDRDRVRELQTERDRVMSPDHEISLGHFPESLASAWEFFCELAGRTPRASALERCRKIGWKTYEIMPDPMSGLETVLDDLAAEYELVLYTMGEPEVQRRKIDYYSLRQWFSVVHIAPIKTVDTLRHIHRPFDPEDVLLVGDSLRTEIRQGLELGLPVIHRAPEEMWHYHDVPVDGDFPSITELPEIKDHLP